MPKLKNEKVKTTVLCDLVKKRYHRDHPKKYKALLKGASYMCRKCGRAASCKNTLCKPVDI